VSATKAKIQLRAKPKAATTAMHAIAPATPPWKRNPTRYPTARKPWRGRDGVLAVRVGRSCRRFVGCGVGHCALCGCGSTVRGDGWRFGAGLRVLAGLGYDAGGGLRGAAETEDHTGQDGEGAEEPERGDGAGAGQGDGGQ